MSHKLSSEISSIGTIEAQVVDKQALKRENLETLKIEDKASSTPAGAVHYDVNLSKVTVLHQTPRRDIKDGNPTCSGHVTGKTYKENTKAPKTPIGEVLKTQNTGKGENGRQTVNGDFKTLKTDNETSTTPGGDKSVKARP